MKSDPLRKTLTYEQIRQELIDDIRQLEGDEDSIRAMGIGKAMSRYTDKMVERALSKFEYQSQHLMEVGRAAEAFFGSFQSHNPSPGGKEGDNE